MTITPTVTTATDFSPEQQLDGVRKNADRLLAFLLVLHFPVALALAPLHGSWAAAIVAGGVLSGLAWFVAQTAPGSEPEPKYRLVIELSVLAELTIFPMK